METYFEDSRLHALVSETDMHIFDMNGLLLNDEPLHLAAVNQALKPRGIRVSKKYWIDQCVGHDLRHNLSLIVNDGLGDADYEQLIANYMENFGRKIGKRAREILRPGVLDIIHYLGITGKGRSVATSARRELAELILGSRGLVIQEEFSTVVTRDDAPGKMAAYSIASRNYDPNRCVAYEDSGYGVDAAYEAGIPCIAVPSEFTCHQDFGRAVYIVDNLTPKARITGGTGSFP